MTKKIFTFILALFAIAATAGAQGGVVINSRNFPFTNFRKFVKDNYDKDHDNYLNQGEIAAVTKINVFNRSIGDLKGIEFFMELEELDCRQNQLTSLDVSQNTKLTELCCYNNQIKGDKMQALVNSLPTVEGEEKGKFYVINTKNENEKNVITKSQVAIAKGKGWTVYDYNGGSAVEYEGSDGTTGIGGVEADGLDKAAWYTLDGKKLSGEPTRKGVYIYKGRKVVK